MAIDHSSFGPVQDRNLTPTTDITAQLRDATIAEREIFLGGYYAASGRLANGDLVEMWIVEERAVGSTGKASYVRLALNGISNRRRYELAGDTAELAEWLRGYHLGSDREVNALAAGGAEILGGLYRDTAREAA